MISQLSQNFSKILRIWVDNGENMCYNKNTKGNYPLIFRKGNEENELLDRLGRDYRHLLDCVAFAETSLKATNRLP